MLYEVVSDGELFTVLDKMSGEPVKTGTFLEVEEFLDQQDERIKPKKWPLLFFWR